MTRCRSNSLTCHARFCWNVINIDQQLVARYGKLVSSPFASFSMVTESPRKPPVR